MIEEPPPLPFPSLKKLQTIAKEVLEALRNPATQPKSYKFCPAVATSSEVETKRPKKKDACDNCRKKKVKCDNNNEKDEKCVKANCICVYHVACNDPTDTPSPYDGNRNNPTTTNNDFVRCSTSFRKAGLLPSGHYAGETSFCAYTQPEYQPKSIKHETDFPTLDIVPVSVPQISFSDQLYLIEVYYQNINPFFPIINKNDLIEQLHLLMEKGKTYLSPLFFYALFARAAHVATDRTYTEASNQQTFESLGNDCVTYVSALVSKYQDTPRVSTVLALIIMANHLEQTKLPQNLTRSWLWAGEAFRIALDLGIHRASISEKNTQEGQLGIRTFWMAYITDCTISMTYGRPSATEEKVLDVTAPQALPNDDSCTTEWLHGLNSLVSLSKIAARVIKFNYCPPPPFKVSEPVKRHNAFLASVDSWLTDIMHPYNDPGTPPSTLPNTIVPESQVARRMNFQKQMFFYTNLILLHRPYVNDTVTSRSCTRPSYDICSYAAIIITDSAYGLQTSDLSYHSKSPMITYALVMAMRIHILNATTNPNSNVDKFNSERNYERGMETLKKLPQYLNENSLLHKALIDLQEQFDARFTLSTEQEEERSKCVPQENLFQDIIPVYTGQKRGPPTEVPESSTHHDNALKIIFAKPSRSKVPNKPSCSPPAKKSTKVNNKPGLGVFRANDHKISSAKVPKHEASSSRKQPKLIQPQSSQQIQPPPLQQQQSPPPPPQESSSQQQKQKQPETQLNNQMISPSPYLSYEGFPLYQETLRNWTGLNPEIWLQQQQPLEISNLFTDNFFNFNIVNESPITQQPALVSGNSSPTTSYPQSPELFANFLSAQALGDFSSLTSMFSRRISVEVSGSENTNLANNLFSSNELGEFSFVERPSNDINDPSMSWTS